MPALLTGAIPTQNFELVRDRIAQVLAYELTAQAAMTSPVTSAPTVFTERLSAIDDTELAVINVSWGGGEFGNKDERNSDGTYTYNVDVYTNSAFTDDSRGDTLAAMEMQRLIGQCRAILENPQYRTLNFTPPSLSRVWVNSIILPEKSSLQDATQGAKGRLVFNVRVPEGVELKEGVLIGDMLTVVKLHTTEKGYLWGAESNYNNTIETSRGVDLRKYTLSEGLNSVVLNDGGFVIGFTDDLPGNAIVRPIMFVNNDGSILDWEAQGITRNNVTKIWNLSAYGGFQPGTKIAIVYALL